MRGSPRLGSAQLPPVEETRSSVCHRGLGEIWGRPCPLPVPPWAPLRPQNPARGAESLASDRGLLFRRLRAAIPWRPRPASPPPGQSPSYRDRSGNHLGLPC